MYHPTSRVLAVLELLQAKPSITGPELAARMETSVRTVRRYITHLQDAGIPIEATTGRIGGYRLRPGFKLPPLIFTEEEATAIVMGLLASPWTSVKQSQGSIEAALAKISRVLPQRARERLQAVSSHAVLFRHNEQAQPSASLLIELSEAIHGSQRISIDYLSSQRASTRRTVEPYGITGWRNNWYLSGYCCLRQEYRVFRLDRIQQLQVLTETFEKAPDFDYESFVREKYGTGKLQTEVEFKADLLTVQQRASILYGTLTPTETGVLYQEQNDNIDEMARYLMSIGIPFEVHSPPELRDALRKLGKQIFQIADGPQANEDEA